MSEILAEYGLIRAEEGRWIFPEGSVRVTPEGSPSVFDLLRVLAGKKNPRCSFKEFLSQNPESSNCIVKYKFPGRGQQLTPVLLDLNYIPYLIDYNLIYSRASRSLILKYNNPKPLTEKNLQSAIVEYLKECNESPREYVRCFYGVADIVTENTVIEVKDANNWKAAVGQVLLYNKCFNLTPEIAVFGKGNFELIMRACTELCIACCCYPSDSDLTRAMLENTGCWTYSNYEKVKHSIQVKHIARYN